MAADEEIRFMGVVERNRILSQMMAIAKEEDTPFSMLPVSIRPTPDRHEATIRPGRLLI